MYGTLARAALRQLDQGCDQAALGDQRSEQSFQNIRLHRLDTGSGFLSQGFHAGLNFGDVGPGGKVASRLLVTCSEYCRVPRMPETRLSH